jgi:tetratricopeptide (TPR) repeat protein
MMEAHFERGQVLMAQGRYDMAAGEYRLALAVDADNGLLHALLGLCLVETEQYTQATEEAQQAIRLEPDLDFGHFVLARALAGRNRLGEAEVGAREAIRLDPDDANNYALLAGIQFEQRRWQAALDAADEGLRLDPEHIGCVNLRAMALVKLGRSRDAEAVLADTLARDPENAISHANQGWTLLHRGQTGQALEHFSEALRLEPGNESARAGIVEAMKARNPIYGLLLRYFLWMARLSGGAQWAIVLGLLFGQRLLQDLARQNPALKPWVMPILVLYVVFAVMTWIASPLFNLVLRLDRFGRHALTREEVVASNWIGALLVPALVSLVAWLVTDSAAWLLAMIYFGLLMLPVSVLFAMPAGWPRQVLAIYTGALATTVPAAVVSLRLAPDLTVPLVVGFMWGAFLSGFLANGLMMVRVRR